MANIHEDLIIADVESHFYSSKKKMGSSTVVIFFLLLVNSETIYWTYSVLYTS